MPKICDVKDVPVGGVYRDYDPDTKEPTGREVTCLSKGTQNGIGYNLIHRLIDGAEIRDMHFTFRNPVLWINDTPEGVVAAAANLLVQAVVFPGEKTDEGQLIEAVTIPWFEIIEALKRNPELAFEISPRKWEEIVAGAYKKAGFDEVTLTPSSGDLGRDVIAVKRGLGTVRIIDQVKAYKPGHWVTANDVRALLGVLQGDRASKGFLTTTSDFAPRLADDALLKPFIPASLELINGIKLLKRLKELAMPR
jgi:restriction system protein